MLGIIMINQYTSESFVQAVETHYQKPICEALDELCDEGISYEELAQILNYKTSTVRKWCRKYNIRLRANQGDLNTKSIADILALSVEHINTKNVLYRKWGNGQVCGSN